MELQAGTCNLSLSPELPALADGDTVLVWGHVMLQNQFFHSDLWAKGRPGCTTWVCFVISGSLHCMDSFPPSCKAFLG